MDTDFSTEGDEGADSKRGVTSRKTAPKDCRVVMKSLVDPLDIQQRGERQINPIYCVRQVSRVKGIVCCPSNWTGGQHVKWKANQKPADPTFSLAGFFVAHARHLYPEKFTEST